MVTPINLRDAEEEALRDFEDYRHQLIHENGYSRNQALCEAYHHLSVLWEDDILQQATTKAEAEYCRRQADKFEKLSNRYCDKQ